MCLQKKENTKPVDPLGRPFFFLCVDRCSILFDPAQEKTGHREAKNRHQKATETKNPKHVCALSFVPCWTRRIIEARDTSRLPAAYCGNLDGGPFDGLARRADF
jgi:hypothetical protein